jgi:Flp pilus assembly pilin Flp
MTKQTTSLEDKTTPVSTTEVSTTGSRGASLVEYALLLASMVLIMLVAYRGFSDATSTMFSGVASDLEAAN